MRKLGVFFSLSLCAFVSISMTSNAVLAATCAKNLDEIKATFVTHANEVANAPAKVSIENVWASGTHITKSGDEVVLVQAQVNDEKARTSYIMTGVMECDPGIQKFDVYYYTLTGVHMPKEECPAPTPAPTPEEPTPPADEPPAQPPADPNPPAPPAPPSEGGTVMIIHE